MALDEGLREGVAPVRDRLISMLLLAALLHGIVILGITFGSAAGPGARAPSLQVLLVGDEVPTARANAEAAYLAQRTQLGSGNTTAALAAELPRARASGAGGTASHPGQEQSTPGTQGSGLLATWGPATRVIYEAPPAERTAPVERLAGEEQPASAGAGSGDALTLRGTRREELYVTADTRESELAPYLDNWKQRVERIGTLNYPSAAQRLGLRGSPVLEVIIEADGRLRQASIRSSSGHAEIDAAALQILRLASPFDPFPADLAARHGTLRFAYEWQFVGGRLGQGAVSVP